MKTIAIPQTYSAVAPARPQLTAALTRTDDSVPLTLLRLALAIVIFPHGAQKLLGWFGGYGFEATMQFFTATLGIPYVLALLAVATEVGAPILLVLGLGSRVAALAIAIHMTVATCMVHLTNGFFMNWTGQQSGEGFQFHILAAAMALAIVIGGSGRWSVDQLINRKTV